MTRPVPLLMSLLVLQLPQMAAAAETPCLLEVEGQTYISGNCDYRPLSEGLSGYQITGADGRYFAYVYATGEEQAQAYWNGKLGESSAHDPLGDLRREGDCWRNDKARICVSAVSAPSAVAAGPYGRWDCAGVMEFELDAASYAVGLHRGAVQSVEQIGAADFGVTLVDGYRFAIFDVTATGLTWHSPESGDTFECKRKS